MKILNFLNAIIKHTLDGFEDVSDEKYEARLAKCEKCVLRTDDWVCDHPKCGCHLKIKAKWASERCPLSLWPDDPLLPNNKKGCSFCPKNKQPINNHTLEGVTPAISEDVAR